MNTKTEILKATKIRFTRKGGVFTYVNEAKGVRLKVVGLKLFYHTPTHNNRTHKCEDLSSLIKNLDYVYKEWIKEYLIISKRLTKLFNTWCSYKGDEYIFSFDTRKSINEDYQLNLDKPRFGNYFDIVKGNITYNTKEQVLNENNKWMKEGREIIKPSKLIKYFIKENCLINDNKIKEELIIESFTNTIKSHKCGEILISSNPKEIYELDTQNSSGTLLNSCMRPESTYGCNRGTHFFNDLNLDIAYTLKNGKLNGRALIWRGAINKDTNKKVDLMDRIYGSDLVISAFKDYAKENNIAYKTDQTGDNFKLNDLIISRVEYSHNLSEGDNEYYPYFDTITHFNDSNMNNMCNGTELLNCDGTPYGAEYICYECNCDIEEDCEYFISDECYCGECSTYDDYRDEQILTDDAVYIEEDSQWSDTYNTVILSNDEIVHEDSSSIWYINNVAHHIDDVTTCEYCDDAVLNDDIHYNDDLNKSYCEDCEEDCQAELKELEVCNE